MHVVRGGQGHGVPGEGCHGAAAEVDGDVEGSGEETTRGPGATVIATTADGKVGVDGGGRSGGWYKGRRGFSGVDMEPCLHSYAELLHHNFNLFDIPYASTSNVHIPQFYPSLMFLHALNEKHVFAA